MEAQEGLLVPVIGESYMVDKTILWGGESVAVEPIFIAINRQNSLASRHKRGAWRKGEVT